jgi:hypothetical protein
MNHPHTANLNVRHPSVILKFLSILASKWRPTEMVNADRAKGYRIKIINRRHIE